MPRDEPSCLIVLGTHRSGTSMTAGVAHAAGFQFGGPLGGPAADNPSGFFEHLHISRHHDRLLAEVGLQWCDVGDPLARATPEQLARWVAETDELFTEIAADLPTFCWKDPRTLRFLPMWHEVLRRHGRVVRHLVAVRDPRHVAASLLRRNALPVAASEQLWLFDHATMARHLHGLSAPVSVYAESVGNPGGLLRMLARLGAPDADGAADAVAAFVARDLDHGRDPSAAAVHVPLATPVYEAIVAAHSLASITERA